MSRPKTKVRRVVCLGCGRGSEAGQLFAANRRASIYVHRRPSCVGTALAKCAEARQRHHAP